MKADFTSLPETEHMARFTDMSQSEVDEHLRSRNQGLLWPILGEQTPHRRLLEIDSLSLMEQGWFLEGACPLREFWLQICGVGFVRWQHAPHALALRHMDMLSSTDCGGVWQAVEVRAGTTLPEGAAVPFIAHQQVLWAKHMFTGFAQDVAPLGKRT